MKSEAKVLQFPAVDQKMTCHVRFPNVSGILQSEEYTHDGMTYAAAEMQEVAERFDDLALLFEECPEASFSSGTHFHDGGLVFIFQVPRRYRPQLLEMGFDPIDVDV